jgi:Uma2 family endonuclease
MAVRLQPGGLLRVPMSREDYLALGEARHHEWYDGMCVVSPPTLKHQYAEDMLSDVLRPYLPRDRHLFRECGWQTAHGQFEPDLLVLPTDLDYDAVWFKGVPDLVVEVLSASNRRADLVRKRELYAAAGLRWYWVVDVDEPSIRIFDRQGDELVERQYVRTGDDAIAVGPYPVRLRAADLRLPSAQST